MKFVFFNFSLFFVSLLYLRIILCFSLVGSCFENLLEINKNPISYFFDNIGDGGYTFFDGGGINNKRIKYKKEMRKFPHPRSKDTIEAVAKRWGSLYGFHAAEAFELVTSRIKNFNNSLFS